MSKINDLIKALGNDDIERVSLGSLMTRIKEKNYDNSNILTVYSVTKENGIVKSDDLHDFSVYSNDLSNYYILRKNQYAYNPARLNIGSIARLKNDETGLVSPMYVVFELNNSKINYDYFEYLLFSKKTFNDMCSFVEQGARFRFDYKNWDKVYIDLPPIEVQEKIVRILDKFDKLEDELESEIAVRKIQYKFWSGKLFNKGDYKKLCDLAEIGTGSSNTNQALPEGKYCFYTRSQEIYYMNEYEYDDESIITAGDGAGVGKSIHYVNGKYALHQRAYRICPNSNILLPKYLYFYMKYSFYKYILNTAVSSSVTSIRRKMLNDYLIPVPSIEEQRKIVNILDKFDKLVNDISEGVPAEIELRKKQYEYYRNKLLNFEELKNE